MAYYDKRLSSINSYRSTPVENGDHYDIYQNYEFIAQNRDTKHFLEKKIRTPFSGVKGVHQWKF